MPLSIKNISFFFIILFGFALFLTNVTKLNINNKTVIQEKNNTESKNKIIKKESLNIDNVKPQIILDRDLSDNSSKKLK